MSSTSCPMSAHPMDYEVFEVERVHGYGTGSDSEQEFLPLYSAFHTEGQGQQAYYCQQREPRVLSERQRKLGPRSSYVGAEVFLSLVDPREAPLPAGLRQLAVKALCTNRDLPLHLAVGVGRTDFILEVTAPVDSVRVLAGPSKPAQRGRDASHVWQLVNHLSLNHLSLSDTDPDQGAAALRTLLGLYAQSQDAAAQRQIEGIRHVRVTPARAAAARGRGGRARPSPSTAASPTGARWRWTWRWTSAPSRAAAPTCWAACWGASSGATPPSTPRCRPC